MPTIASEALRAYEAYVAEMAARADGTVILNHTLEHATIILAQIFKTSNQAVQILSGKLDERAYDGTRVTRAACDFLDRNPAATIDILTETDVSATSPFVAHLRQHGGERITVGTLAAKLAPSFHFAVGDKKHLRFEAEKDKCKAFVQFGGEKHGAHFSDTFAAMKAVS